jgi:hypothetical protein
VQAVERAHFFSQPVFVPIINWDKPLGLTGYFATEISDSELWRLVPKTAKFTGTTISHNIYSVKNFGTVIKQLITRRLT